MSKQQNTGQKRKSTAKVILTIEICYILSCLALTQITAQDVFYSTKKIGIHAQKAISNDKLVIKNLNQLIKEIERKCITETNKELCTAFIDDLEIELENYIDDLNNLFIFDQKFEIDEHYSRSLKEYPKYDNSNATTQPQKMGKNEQNEIKNNTIRVKRNINVSTTIGKNETNGKENNKTRTKRYLNFVGDFIKMVGGNPSGEDWEKQTAINKKLLEVVKQENEKMTNLKKRIKHEKTEMSSVLEKVQAMNRLVASTVNETNQEGKVIIELMEIVTIHTRGKSLLSQAHRENSNRKDIVNCASLNLPSKIMFPTQTVKETILEHAKLDKIKSPIFLTDNEIDSLYNFQCCKTMFDKREKVFHSYMELPWTDFSNKMMTLNLPKLNPNDLNRIHFIETIAKKSIDKILCNDVKKSMRLLSLKDLKTCQKHRQKNMYLCTKREVTMKIDLFMSCIEIDKLPKTMIMEVSENKFIIDRQKPDTLRVFCKGKFHHEIRQKMGPIVVNLPTNCKLVGKTTKIDELKIESKSEEIMTKEKLRIIPINFNKFKPFQKEEIIEISSEKTVYEEKSDDYDEEIDNTIDQLEKDIQETELLSTNWNSFFAFLSLGIAITAFSIIMIKIILKRRCCKQPKETNSKNKSGNIELEQKKLDQKKLNELEIEIRELNKEIDLIKESQLDIVTNYKNKLDHLIKMIEDTDRRMDNILSCETKTKEQFENMAVKLTDLERQLRQK